MELKGEIYLITNLINQKQYVGQTYDYRKKGNKYIEFGYQNRFKEHLNKKNQTKYLSAAIEEFGKINFKTELIITCDPSLTNTYETKYIRYYNTLHPNGYNGTEGGDSIIPCEDMKKNISETLKKYYQDTNILKSRSEKHMNKFNEFDKNQIEYIEINPIKTDGEYKIVYMYVKCYNKEEKHRRRYGGKHINYIDSLQRCKTDALRLLDGDEKKLLINNSKNLIKMRKITDIVKIIEIKKHKLNDNFLTSVYITTNNTKLHTEKQRFVFGGKTINFSDSYKLAIEFVNEIKSKDTKIIDNINLG